MADFELPAELDAKLIEIAKRGRKAWDLGDTAAAEKDFLEIWEMIPEPKLQHGYWSQVHPRSMVAFYTKIQKLTKAERWLAMAREAYDAKPGSNPSIDFLEAAMYYDCGQLDKASPIFDALYKRYKKRPFQGKDPKYLDFCLKRPTASMGARKPDMERMSTLSEEGNVLSESGRFQDAIAKWTEALNLLPEPKVDWDAATWLYASIGDAHFQQKQFEDCLTACLDALNCPGGQENPFIQLRLGQACFELGEKDQAADALARAYMGGGKELFDADDVKYWQFISSKLKPPESGK